MIKVGNIYSYITGRSDYKLYAQLVELKESDNCKLRILAPSTPDTIAWSVGNVVEYWTSSLKREWDKCTFTLCIKCEKWNPCRRSEVLCGGCRSKK